MFLGERHTANLTLKPDTYQRAKERGFRVVTQVNLPPGRYQLRLAAGNKTGKAGSVIYDLDVPEFYKEPFVMSGVALTAASASLTPTVNAKNPLGDFLPGPPIAAREFDVGDTLMFFAEFYENGANNPHTRRSEGGAPRRRAGASCSRPPKSARPARCAAAAATASPAGCRSPTSSPVSTCCTSKGARASGRTPPPAATSRCGSSSLRPLALAFGLKPLS